MVLPIAAGPGMGPRDNVDRAACTQRPHQGLGNAPPKPTAELPDTSKPVVRHDLLGGLIHVYRRAA